MEKVVRIPLTMNYLHHMQDVRRADKLTYSQGRVWVKGVGLTVPAKTNQTKVGKWL